MGIKGDDTEKALSPGLGTCNGIISVREGKSQKLVRAEQVETAYNAF